MLRKQLSVSPWQRREVFVILILVMGFPHTLRTRRRRSWRGLCYSSSGDSSGSSQKKSRRIWEGSCWVQDLRKQPPAQRMSKLRFPWWYWFWDIYLREGSNGVKVRKERKGKEIFMMSVRIHFPSSWSYPLNDVWTDLSLKAEQDREVWSNPATSEETVKRLMDKTMQEFFSSLLASAIWNCL